MDFNDALSEAIRYSTEQERAAFESAIDQNPLESTNHLVYADWLQDQGHDEEAAFRRAMGEWHQKGQVNEDDHIRQKCRLTKPSPLSGNTVHVRIEDLPPFVGWDTVEDIPRSPDPAPLREHAPETAYSSGSGTFSWDKYRNFEKAMRSVFRTHWLTHTDGAQMIDFNADLNEVIRYQRERLPVSAIHPELRFSRLGAVLREHATEPSDVGELAYQALTSPHDQPLELMPLHLLRDKMQEEPDHPLAKRFNWQRVPEHAHIDSLIQQHIDRNPDTFRDAGEIADLLHLSLLHSGDLKRIQQAVSSMDDADYTAAVDRLIDQRYNRMSAAQQIVAGFKNGAEDVHTSIADTELHPHQTHSRYDPSPT